MWRQVGTAGWICDIKGSVPGAGWTLTAWHQGPDGWVWRCRNDCVAADPRHRMRDGKAETAEAAMRAADAAHAALVADEAARTPHGRRPR